MRSPRLPFALGALGVAVTIASCTLITDVDRSRIPDDATGGSAGAGTGGRAPASGGEGGVGATGGTGGSTNEGGAAGEGGLGGISGS